MDTSNVTSCDSAASDGCTSSPTAAHDAAVAVTARKRPLADALNEQRKPRSRWYALQKEEKAQLVRDAKALEARVAFLHDMPENTSAARVLARLQRENDVLRSAMRTQQLQLAGAQSALTHNALSQPVAFERPIHLGRDQRAREAAFAALEEPMLRDAEQYLRARSQSLDPSRKYSSLEHATAANGDFIVRVFESMPLGCAASVARVFDALQFFFVNLDLSLTESSGELVVRESEHARSAASSSSCGVTHLRLLRSTRSGVQIESNCVVACAMRQAHGDESSDTSEHAVIAVNAVDSDELYPYASTARVRQDISVALTVRAVPRRVTPVLEQSSADSSVGGSGDVTATAPEQQADIVICRAYATRLHCSELSVQPEVLTNTVAVAEMCTREILRAVYDVVHSLSSDA